MFFHTLFVSETGLRVLLSTFRCIYLGGTPHKNSSRHFKIASISTRKGLARTYYSLYAESHPFPKAGNPGRKKMCSTSFQDVISYAYCTYVGGLN